MGIDKVGDRIVNIWYEDRYANVLNFAYGSPIPTYQGVFKFSNKQAAGGFGWEWIGNFTWAEFGSVRCDTTKKAQCKQ